MARNKRMKTRGVGDIGEDRIGRKYRRKDEEHRTDGGKPERKDGKGTQQNKPLSYRRRESRRQEPNCGIEWGEEEGERDINDRTR